jgi:hypothetical protein
MKYYFETTANGTMDVVADDVFTTVALANSDDSNDLASRLLEVKAINPTAGALGARAFLDCGGLGPRFEPLYYGSGLSLGESCFEGCYGIREFAPRFLAKVTSSGVAAFARCTSLRTIDGMSAFDPCAEKSFYRCSSLLSLQGGFSSAATTFGEKCFDGCSSLQTLSGVPSTLEELLPYCFARCTSLSDITALASTAVEELPTGCFYRCASLASPNCGTGSGITTFGKSCFEDCSSLVSMTGTPAGLRAMLARCFAKTPVASLSGLPSTIEDIGDECYDACDLLPSLAGLPTSLHWIGERCFRDSYGEDHPVEEPPEKVSTEWGLHDLSRLEDVVPGLENKQISKGCFTGDRMIRELPDLTGLTTKLTVRDYAFSGCSGLDSLAGLPANVELKEGAFMDCFRAPHDWWRLDETEDPPVIKKTKRWCGLYDVDMSGWADTVTKLPARCFQGCGALAELPPLPPKLMEMGDYCFAYCTGMKNLDSLADLDVQITDGSTHFGYGTPHGPTYPSFGEWCFAGCGVKTREPEWEFFNDPEHPPDIGRLENFWYGLKPLCDRMEMQAASHMSASSSAIMDELLAYIERMALDAMDTIVPYDVHALYGHMMRSGLDTPDLLLLAATVEHASRAAASGWSLYTSMPGALKETLSQDYPYARDNVRHDVIAILMPRGDGLALWICCPGLADDILEYPLDTSEPQQRLEATYGNYAVVFDVKFDDGDVSMIVARVCIIVNVTRIAVTNDTRLLREDFQEPEDAEELALSFLRFMAYVDAALLAKHSDHAELPFAMELPTLYAYVIEQLKDGAAALSKLRDLNLVTPASKMLGAHCFDGCTYLDAGGFPKLIADVPPYCFANTAVADLSNFSHVYTLGTGAFSHTLVEDMSGFPQAVPFVSARLFQGCESLRSLGGLPRRVSPFLSYAYGGCTSLADLRCTTEDEWPDTGVNTALQLELWRATGVQNRSELVIDAASPPLAAFCQARAVDKLGASCFQGDTSLTDASFTVSYSSPSISVLRARVSCAVAQSTIYTIEYPSSRAMWFLVVFHLADDLDLVVRFQDDPTRAGPDGASAIQAAHCVDGDGYGFSSYVGTDHADLVVVRGWRMSGGFAVPSEAWTDDIVVPARYRPQEDEVFDIASVSPEGHLRLLLGTGGYRFEVLLSYRVDRTVGNGGVVSAVAVQTGHTVTVLGSAWPGYPAEGETKTYSAVPCLRELAASCFEGCTGLNSRGWLPFGVTSFPARCFAGVPFTHPVEYEVIPPKFLEWKSPTVDLYKDAIEGLLDMSKIYVDVASGDFPDSVVLRSRSTSGEAYIRFTVSYAEADGEIVPSLALDLDHMATERIDGDMVSNEYNAPLVSVVTKGLSGPLEVVSPASGGGVTLRVGTLTLLLSVANRSTSSDYASLDFSCAYVSCPQYDEMVYALHEMNGTTQVSYTDFDTGRWSVTTCGSAALIFEFRVRTGLWKTEYGAFCAPVSSAVDADCFPFDELRGVARFTSLEKLEGRYWFISTVYYDQADVTGPPYVGFYAYAEVDARPVAVVENSVIVPPWVTWIGKDCFTFKGFEDVPSKLEGVYLHQTAEDIVQMPNYPWGVPSGCCIYSTVDGQVYPPL